MVHTRKVFFGVIACAVVLASCVFPEHEDPFSRLPEEPTQTLEGKVYPFSVSVSTRATHRLEKDGKLAAYLASDIVRLDDFEGREVEVEGVVRNEKMREIFWVEAIKAQNVPQKDEKPLDELFETKTFAFLYPPEWEYSTSPDGTAHFVDKTDVARRVFLTFGVRELEREDTSSDPNVLIAHMAGIQETSEDLGRERQEITLFSNTYDRKYTFIFTTKFEDFEKKKAFFRLLNSFVEGEDEVMASRQQRQKLLAQRESDKVKEADPLGEDASEEQETPSLLDRLFGEDEEVSPEPEAVVSASPEEMVGDDYQIPETFSNLIDDKAFGYESAYYGFSMKVPWGYWFWNFGASEKAVANVGFADHPIAGSEDVEFWMYILGDQNPPKVFSERIEAGKLVLDFPRSDTSFFRLEGPVKFRDAMRSVQTSLVQFGK